MRISTHLSHTKARRRGAILIVVLAMLALFAILGISFVLYASSQATISKNDVASKNIEAEPNPLEGAEQALGVFVFDTDNQLAAVRGHSLARSRFGGNPGALIPFNGTGTNPGAITIGAATLDRTELMNFVGSGQNLSDGNYNNNVPFTSADRNNFWLAVQNPQTGEITTKSFHRDDLFNLATGSADWTSPQGQFKTLRPRPQEHPGFPFPTPNADGSITGDVCNMKFITGVQKHDSIWMYAGAPIKSWRGKQYTYLVAPLILDLSARVNLSAVGTAGSNSNLGLGPWEINPGTTGLNTNALVSLRQPSGITNEPYTLGNSFTFNKGQNPPHYGRVDFDGLANGGDGPIQPPPAGGSSPFPTYPMRYNDVGVQPAHPAQFNPLNFPHDRSATNAHAFGYDEVVRLGTRYSSNKANWYSAASLNGVANTPQLRALTTPFSVSSAWSQISIRTGPNPTDTTQLGPIDLNRKLNDYRTNPAQAYHPENMGNAQAAKRDRQNLAREIFIRLAAISGLVDGAQNYYNPTTGYITIMANVDSFRPLAQYAANVVDNIDPDDISTAFVWNPAAPNPNADTVLGDVNNFTVAPPDVLGNHVVFGTELPRLVVNEAYCELVNDRRDETNPMQGAMNGTFRAAHNLQKRYFLELHNPFSADGNLSDTGSARLKWEVGVSPDASGGAGGYTGAAISPYRVEILEHTGKVATALTDSFNASANNVTGDTSGADGGGIGGITRKISYNTFTYDATAPAPMPTLMGDELNIVRPANNAMNGAPGSNQGYYVISPIDAFPAAGVTPSMTTADPPAMPMGPVQSMIYDAGVASDAGAMPNITEQRDRQSSVVLQRLANPYAPGNTPDNPYITVDYIEAVPTRDRVLWTNTDRAAPRPQNNDPSVGRIHPYAHFRSNGVMGLNDAVVNQSAAMMPMAPEHTFFRQNLNATNTEWLAHFDREFVNSTELLQVHRHPSHMLTQTFYNGMAYQAHIDPTPQLLTGGYYRAFDLLSTKSRYVGTPLGGRIPGQLNINTIPINDGSLFNALMNPQGGNSFDQTFVNTLFGNVGTSRTTSPYWSGSATPDIERTLLRSAAATPGVPMSLFNNSAPAYNHSYNRQEPLRRAWNNITTTSDGFLVIMTVGVFEVTNATGGPGGMPLLGKEMYRSNAQGDMRQQYAAVIDRSKLNITEIGNNALSTNKPWEVDLVGDVEAGTGTISVRGLNASTTTFDVWQDGVQVRAIDTGSATQNRVRIGFGDVGSNTGDGEWATVTGVAAGPAGTVTLTLGAATSQFHGGGSPVRNVILGNPGPQPSFNFHDPKFKAVIPYFTRIEP